MSTELARRPQSAPAERLSILVRAVSGDEASRGMAADILLSGLRTWMKADGRIPLERCCGLPPPTARRAFSRAQRDLWLSEAHRLCPGASHWQRSRALLVELRRFSSAVWPVWRDATDPPPGTSALRTALFRALKHAEQLAGENGLPAIPGTARGLDFAVKGIASGISQPLLDHGGSEELESA